VIVEEMREGESRASSSVKVTFNSPLIQLSSFNGGAVRDFPNKRSSPLAIADHRGETIKGGASSGPVVTPSQEDTSL
jgi:hypothetical protein